MPVPPNSRVMDESAWKNGSNSRDCTASGMPMPAPGPQLKHALWRQKVGLQSMSIVFKKSNLYLSSKPALAKQGCYQPGGPSKLVCMQCPVFTLTATSSAPSQQPLLVLAGTGLAG
jgi:hypothetical protein